MLIGLVAGGVGGTLLSLLFGVSYITIIATLLLAYLPSYADGAEYSGVRYWPWFATHSIWKTLFGYFPGKMVYSTPIDPEKNYIFGSHPHGVSSLHHLMYMCDGSGFHDVSPGKTRRDVSAPIVFAIPILRDVVLWGGGVHASSSTARRMLNQKRSLMILPGGMNEQILSKPGDHTVFIKNRKGFCVLALRNGVPIVPIYVFGENDLFSTSNICYDLRHWILKTFRIAIPIPTSLPRKTPLVACVGVPIDVEQTTADPSTEQIDTLHKQYMEGLQKVFDENKAAHGYPDGKLNII